MNINVVIQNAEKNSDSDWTGLLGCKNGALVSKLFKKLNMSDTTVVNNNIQIPLFIEEFAQKVLILRLISGWLEINNKLAFISISKTIHEFFKYMVDFNDSSAENHQTSIMMEKGLLKYITDLSADSKNNSTYILNGGAHFEPKKIERNDEIEFLNLVYRTLVKTVLSFLPKANITKGVIENVTKNIKPNFSVVPRNSGILQESTLATSSYPISSDVYQGNLTKRPKFALSTVTPPIILLNRQGRRRTRRNAIVSYSANNFSSTAAPGISRQMFPYIPVPKFFKNVYHGYTTASTMSDEVIFQKLTRTSAMPKTLPNANPSEVSGPNFYNVTIPQFFKDMYSRYAIASAFNHKFGESSFQIFFDKSGKLQIGDKITYGTRSSVTSKLVTPSVVPIANAHLHPLAWSRYTSPESNGDANTHIISAFATGVYNELVFTQGGLVTLIPNDETLEFIRNFRSQSKINLDPLEIKNILLPIFQGKTNVSLSAWKISMDVSYKRDTFVRSFIIPNNEKYKMFFCGKYTGLSEFKITTMAATYDWSLSQVALVKHMGKQNEFESSKFTRNLNFPFKHTKKMHTHNLTFVNSLFKKSRAINLQKTLLSDFRKFTVDTAIIGSFLFDIINDDPILHKDLHTLDFNAMGIPMSNLAFTNRTRVENKLLDVVFGLGRAESKFLKQTGKDFEVLFSRGKTRRD